jgi:preprotein translocase subunit Sec63
MNEFSFNKIDKARKLLGLSQEATLEDIKEAYRNKAKQYHPDRSVQKQAKEHEEKMAQINQSYRILLKYIEEYRFSFRKEDVDRNSPDKDMRRFFGDWLEK